MTTAKSRQTFLVEKMEKKLLEKFNIALNLKWKVEWTSTVFPNVSTCLVWYLFLFLINCKHSFNDLPCFPHEMVIDYKVWIHVINIVDLSIYCIWIIIHFVYTINPFFWADLLFPAVLRSVRSYMCAWYTAQMLYGIIQYIYWFIHQHRFANARAKYINIIWYQCSQSRWKWKLASFQFPNFQQKIIAFATYKQFLFSTQFLKKKLSLYHIRPNCEKIYTNKTVLRNKCTKRSTFDSDIHRRHFKTIYKYSRTIFVCL